MVSCPYLQVSLKENGSLSNDSNVTMEIPVHTAIAYALIELEIKHDGHYGEKSSAQFLQKKSQTNLFCFHLDV